MTTRRTSSPRARRAGRVAIAAGAVAASAAFPAVADASGPGTWTPTGLPAPASVTNGAWTLGQASATLAVPNAGLCTAFPSGTIQPNPGRNLMQPYYFPFVKAKGATLEGWFDYRIKDTDEAVAHGTSTDGGLTWSMDASKLRLFTDATTIGKCPASASANNGNDNGQGHPFVMTITTPAGPKTLLYTLNRANADVAPLIVHDITATGAAGLADVEPPGTAGLTGTAGLVDPDGILGLVPGTGTDPVTNPARVLWLRKDKNAYAKQTVLPNATNSCIDTQSQAYTSKKANGDKTVLHVATTTDGITFTDLGPVNGLNNPDDTASVGGFRFIGPNGTILTYDDGSFGLFFSGGNCQDGDSDAYHFIGYAHSTDLVNWSVDNGATNPLVAVDYTYPQTAPQKYYTGRVYDPQVIVNGDGTGTLIFSGYQTGKPLADVGVGLGSPTAYTPASTDAADYRTILVQPLSFQSSPPATVPEAAYPVLLVVSAGLVVAVAVVVVRRRAA